MKAARFDYLRPRDIAEAIAALVDANGGAKALAGGQSLGPMLNLRLARPKVLVDISRLDELRTIADLGDAWRIGGAVTHAQLEDAKGKMAGADMLPNVAAGIAYRAVRNRGTIGGSLAHADPAADWPLALAALDSEIEISGGRGIRKVAADQYMTGAFASVLEDDEIIVGVEVPKLHPAARWGYFKYCRKTGEFPDASAAAVFDPGRGAARIFIGGLSGAPQALSEFAVFVAENGMRPCIREVAYAAVEAAAPALEVPDRRMHTAVLLRALAQVHPL